MAGNVINSGLNLMNTAYNGAGGIVLSGDAVKGGYFVTDTIQNIPSWANVLGTLCYCTSDFQFYQYNGESWIVKHFYLSKAAKEGGTEVSLVTTGEKYIWNNHTHEYISKSDKGAANGVAPLGSDSKIAATYLPSYVDDVLEYATKSGFPATGESGKVYVDKATNITYRWSGSTYVVIGSDLALGETSSSAYRGDRGKVAYDHATTTDANPHGTTAKDVGLEELFKALSPENVNEIIFCAGTSEGLRDEQ